MKRYTMSPGRCIMSVLLYSFVATTGSAGVAISSFPPTLYVKTDTEFTTAIRFYTWSNSVGAFSLRIKFDPTKVQMLGLTTASNSVYAGNLFVNSESFSTGNVRVVGFQASDYASHPEGQAVFDIRWKGSAVAGLQDETTIEVEKIIDGTWKAIEPKAYGTKLETETDGDGLPDTWEESHGLDPSDPNDASRDDDGDGFTNLQEFYAGSDPQRADMAVSINRILRAGNTVVIVFPTRLGKYYRLERSDKVEGTPWLPTGREVVGTGRLEQFVDTVTPNDPKFFYRLVLVP